MRMVKIQVDLSDSLRKEIDKARAETGESISGYIRKALQERVDGQKALDFPMKDIKVLSPGV